MGELGTLAGHAPFQVAFVVVDLEDALTRYSALLGAGPWRCWTFGASDHERCDYRGRSTGFASRLALNDQSPQLELIQPLDGPSSHCDWLDEKGEGLHHLGYVVPSVSEVVQTGSGIGPERDGAWAYIDTSATLGFLIEAVEPPTAMPPVEFRWSTTSPRR
jgi:hypothetical protein